MNRQEDGVRAGEPSAIRRYSVIGKRSCNMTPRIRPAGVVGGDGSVALRRGPGERPAQTR